MKKSIRKPTTHPFNWESDFDRSFLLGQFAKARKIRDCKCSFTSADYRFWLPVLRSAIRSDRSARSLKRVCIVKALSDPAEPLNNPESFIEKCNAIYDDLKTRTKKKFIVFCTITYDGPKLFTTIKDDNCRICWQAKEKSRFYKSAHRARKTFEKKLAELKLPQDPKGLTGILIHLEAFDARDAFDLSADALDRLRGILNLIVNTNRSLHPLVSLFSNKPHAINKFRLGPFRTVHNIDGSLASELFWYEPRWDHESPSVKFAAPAEQTRASIKKWWKRSHSNPLRDIIYEGLLRYCRALDEHDSSAALVGLWGALEALTGTQKEKYEITISRVSRIFKEHPETRQVALHVKNRRNSMIHAARTLEDDEADVVLYQADILVNQMLAFCIKNTFRLQNQNELIRFLDLPLDGHALKRDRELMQYRMKYLKPSK